MHYQLFLQILLQLSSKGTAAVPCENGTIHIEPQRGQSACRITMSLSEGSIPSHMLACIPSTGVFRWQRSGPYLQLDPEAQNLALVDEIEIQQDKYISFKQKIQDFIHISQEWKEILATH